MAKYDSVVSSIFFEKYADGDLCPIRERTGKIADELGIGAPKNLGDTIYSSKLRSGHGLTWAGVPMSGDEMRLGRPLRDIAVSFILGGHRVGASGGGSCRLSQT